jgi:pyrimidine operon attenuation protein/uracil phosphoribosyltransferase
MWTDCIDIIEMEIDSLKSLALVCRKFMNYRTIDRIQRQIFEIEKRASKIVLSGVPASG